MKKRGLLSLILTICMVLSLVPIVAYAFEPAAQTADFTAGDNGVEALALLNAAKTGTTDSTWDSTAKVLTLKGVNFATTATTAVKLPAGSTVLLTEGTENIIASVSEGVGESCSYGIYAEGNLTVEGDGLLTATGGTAKGRDTHSCGIYAYEGNITVSGGAVNAIGSTTDNGSYGNSYGIFAGYDVIISDGTVYAAGGTADSDSYGIFAGYNVTITGGTVTAMGGKAGQTIAYSCGIYADVERVNGVLVGGTVTIENSKVIATGGETVMSRGIQAYNSVTISQGSDVTATGNTAEKYSTGIQADWDSVTIADSKVIATSNTAMLGSNGIFTNGNVTITGSADVTATGGTVTRKQGNDDSRGIYADYVTVEGGTVRATGGEESIASYGICTVYDVTITGGTVIAKGREADMYSDGIYAKGDYDYDNEFIGGGNVTISGGTVTATGDTATWESCGIFAVSSVTLSGTAQVTATGSNAEKFSSGIYVDLTNEGAGLTVSGGSLLAQASSEAESCAALRAEPDLTDYAAYYWRTDAQGSYTEGNFVWNNDPYATYVEITDTPTYTNTYTITLDAGGGTVTITSMTTGTDGKLTEALPTPTRNGYTFDGWFTAAEGGEKVTADTVFTGDTVIYAHWTAGSNIHTHNLTLVSAIDRTCTEAGNKAYYTCDGCGKWFADAAGSVEITDKSSVVIPAKGHTASDWKSDADNHWKVCNAVGCGVIIEGSKTAHSYGDDNVCDICGYTKPLTPPSYSIIEGTNGSWTNNSNGTLTFRANGDFSKFTGVKVDGTLIDAKNYTAVSGSTVVTLKAEYLQTLSVGTHKLTIVYNDGECSTNVEVKAASEQTKPTEGDKSDTTSPKTGDNSNMLLWVALLFVSGFGIIGTTAYSKKKRAR